MSNFLTPHMRWRKVTWHVVVNCGLHFLIGGFAMFVYMIVVLGWWP